MAACISKVDCTMNQVHIVLLATWKCLLNSTLHCLFKENAKCAYIDYAHKEVSH